MDQLMRESQSHPDMKVPMLTGTNAEEFDLAFTAAVRRQNALIVIPLDYLLRTDAIGNMMRTETPVKKI